MCRRVSMTSHAVGASSQVALGPNPRRRTLYLSPPSAGRVSVGLGQAAVLDSGITIPAGGHPAALSYDEWQEGIGDEVTLIADGPGRLVGVTEVYCACGKE